MSLGNGNPKEGDKGSNFNYELKVLQGLEAIAVSLENPSAKTFTSTQGVAIGTGILCSNILKIPANTIGSKSAIEILAKFRRVGGGTVSTTPLIFITNINIAPGSPVAGATILASGASLALINGTQSVIRLATVNGTNLNICNTGVGTASDYSTQTNSIVTIIPSIDQYIVFGTWITGSATAICDSCKVTIY